MHRKLFYAALSPVLGFSLAAAAHATPISAGTYSLTNTTVMAGGDTYTLTGTVTIGSNGLFTAGDITLNDAALGDPAFTLVSSTGSGGYAPVADFAYVVDNGTGQLYLSYLPTLDGSGDIDLCVASANNCNNYQASYSQIYIASAFGYNAVDLNSGTFDPGSTSVTPEPSSIVLLGTGILGMVGVMRRRFVKI